MSQWPGFVPQRPDFGSIFRIFRVAAFPFIPFGYAAKLSGTAKLPPYHIGWGIRRTSQTVEKDAEGRPVFSLVAMKTYILYVT